MNAAWDRAFPDCIHDVAGRRFRSRMRLGLSAVTTLPWAQDVGSTSNRQAIEGVLDNAKAGLIVLDLPPGHDLLHTKGVNHWTIERHTRQLTLEHGEDPVDIWPATRKKQLNRANREGMTAEASQDLDLMVQLHQASRNRKDIRSNPLALRMLLKHLLQEPDTQAWVVRDATGEPIAGGVFHGADDGRCIYGFGGQFRGKEAGRSSRATVLLIATAMRHAAEQGHPTFDFGGSQDKGVDRFYAEFGAQRIPKLRVVRVRGVWKPLLKWRRPDLFPT